MMRRLLGLLGGAMPPRLRGLTKRVVEKTAARDPWVPDWEKLLGGDPEWRRAVAAAKGGPKVLIATSLPGVQQAAVMETLLAAALTLRGAEVHFLLCDEVLSACLNLKWWAVPEPERVADGSWREAEGTCLKCRKARHAFEGLGLPVHDYGRLISPEARQAAAALAASVPAADIPRYRRDGAAVGEHAHAGALRYFSRGDIGGVPGSEAVLRRYFEAALQTQAAVETLVARERFEAAVFHHGIYIPQGVVGEVCRAKGVRVTTWNPAYRKQCFIFSHGDTYHHTLLEEPVSAWKDFEFGETEDRTIKDYLRSRWSGSQDWIWFHGTPDGDSKTLVEQTGIDLSKPVIGLLTNVVWDAQLHYRANAFPSMLDWIEKTVRWFGEHPELQLLIRVHPAEIRGTQPSRQLVVDELKRLFPELPANVFVIPPDSDIDTYAAMARCNSVIIYGTKTGVELTSMGIPVIVAGEAWIRNKGLTTDVSSEAEYYRILGTLPFEQPRLTEAQAREARKYAYHFFMRRMIPVASIRPTGQKVPFEVGIAGLGELAPGRDPGLDVVCDGVLKSAPYIYRAEAAGVPA